jgi:hypothetical protein
MDQQPDEQSTDKEEEDDEDVKERDIAVGTIHVANDKTVVPRGGLSTPVVLGGGLLSSSPVVVGGQSTPVVGGGQMGTSIKQVISSSNKRVLVDESP